MSESTARNEGKRLRMLLVDDAEDSLSGLARLFEMSGYEVATATDGLSAVRLLEGGLVPAIVFTDLMLPDIDGLKVAEAARAHAVPLVVLATGDAKFDLRSHGGAGLVDLVLIKPLVIRKVLAELDRIWAERSGTAQSGADS